HARQHIDVAPARTVGELQSLSEVVADVGSEHGLCIDVGALVVVRRLVSEAEEACRADTVVDRLERPGERRDARQPREVASIELVLDALLDTANHEPLVVLGGKAVHADACAPAEVLRMKHVRSGDALDLAAVIEAQLRSDDTERYTAVRIDVDLRNGNEWRARWIQPARDAAWLRGQRGRLLFREARGLREQPER